MANISEKDLFLYINYPHNLSKDKYEYIKNNYNNFKEELELLKALQNSKNESFSDEKLNELNAKIEQKSAKQTIKLTKYVKHLSKDELIIGNYLDEDEKSKTTLYVDEHKRFICKIINSADSNKIYFFDTKDIIYDFQLNLLPFEEIIYANIDDMPIEISPKQNIELIILTIVSIDN